MAKFPVYPVHILVDSRVIQEELFLNAVRSFTAACPADQPYVPTARLNLIQVARSMGTPCDPLTFSRNLENGTNLLDLKSAFEMIEADFHALEAAREGIGNPEVLLLLGSGVLKDWLEGWRKLETYRAVFLAYWFSDHPVGFGEKVELERLLGSLTQSTPEAPRYKIIETQNADLAAILEDILTVRLAKRIQDRLHASGPIRVESSAL